MSKQSDAKKAQGYVRKHKPMYCMNCAHFQSETTTVPGAFGDSFSVEKNKRCGLGGFAVSKQGTCDYFTGKAE
jgi:hypothetical protein